MIIITSADGAEFTQKGLMGTIIQPGMSRHLLSR